MTNIKEKVDKEMQEFYEQALPEVDAYSIVMKTIDLTLAEVGKVIDDSSECSSYVKKKLKKELGIK